MNKIKVPGILVSLLVLLSCGRDPDKALTEGWKLHAEKGYSIEYPADWELDTSGLQGMSFVVLSQLTTDQDKFRENVNLVIQDLTGMSLNLEQYTTISLNQIKRIVTNGELIESSRHHANGMDFQKVEFSGDQGIIKLQIEQYYWIKDEKAYVLSLTCAADQMSIFKETGEKILNSFRFRKN